MTPPSSYGCAAPAHGSSDISELSTRPRRRVFSVCRTDLIALDRLLVNFRAHNKLVFD